MIEPETAYDEEQQEFKNLLVAISDKDYTIKPADDLFGRYLKGGFNTLYPSYAWRHNNWDPNRQLDGREIYLNGIMPGRIEDFIADFEKKYTHYRQLGIDDIFVKKKIYYTLDVLDGYGRIILVESRCIDVEDEGKQCVLEEVRAPGDGLIHNRPLEIRNVSLRPIKVKEEMVTTNVVWEFKKLGGLSRFYKNTPPASTFQDTTIPKGYKTGGCTRGGGKKSRKSRKNNNRRKTKKHKNHKNHKNHKKSRRKSV